MKIAVLNGSPRAENTAAMVKAFADAAQEAGHEVEVLHVGKMKIAGCLGCNYCHTKGEGKCIQQDDLAKLMPAYLESDMIVYASPIYYFGMSAQMAAAMQRVFCIGKPAKASKAALLLSSGSPGVYEGAIATYKMAISYMGMDDMGIVTAAGAENGSEAKMAEIAALAKSLG
jgi:multimeric flavodoxin WrbA